MENLQGTLLKGYKLEERIGNGGFGAVYRAKQPTIEREVAVKVILPGYANNPDFIRRFESEAHVIARLEHPHITPLYDFWRDPEGAYLVMRYLKGGSIRDTLNKSPYELNAVSQLLDEIASALDFAHRNNVIHRDIKPGNILLDEDGNAYLADFGIAKDLAGVIDNKTVANAVVGSLDYISPEQARSEPVTPRTDIYSLGVTLYEMITGEHPFKDTSSIERLYKHINDPLPAITNLPDNVYDAINEIITRATAKNPQKRYPDVLALAVAFREGIGRDSPSQDRSIVEQLTMREQEVLALIASNMSNCEIAEELVVTLATVKWHITQLYKKLGVRSRVQAIVRARELNLIVNGDTADNVPAPSGQLASISLPEPKNPYKGLHAFQMTDARDFFGRDDLTQKLIDRMVDDDPYRRFLAVVGPSGSGKSSLVKAGLIPVLWKGALPASDKWFVVDMIPGTHPLDKLETALIRVAANQTSQLREQLQRDERGLLRVADIILPGDDTELVIVVDQFEEVFTLVGDEATRQQFLDLLRVAVSDVRSRLRVVVTLRADYYDRPLHYPEFGELIRNRMETVLPLSVKGLERAVRGPAERVGVTFEQGLVEQIVSQMNYQAGALPLLQYALTELFDRREGRLLTNKAYQQIGGAVGALTNRADEVYRGLTEDGQELAHQMFMRLVTLGEGAEDTRRRTTHAELLSITNKTDLMEEIIDQFAAYRLLSLDHDPETRQPTVEVAHEAILREWDRLRQWLNESREDIRQERALSRAAEEWKQHSQEVSYLLRGSRLQQVEKWRDATTLIRTPLEQEYIAQSLKQREKEKQAELERQKRETRLEQRSRNFLRGLVAVFALATLLSGGFGLFALDRQQAALDSAAEAQNVALVSGSQAALANNDTDTAIALALQAVTLNPDSALAQAQLSEAAYAPGTIRRFVGHTDAATTVAISPDGKMAISGSFDDTAILWNLETGETLHRFERHTDNVNDMAFSPDSQMVVTVANDKQVILWDVETGESIRDYVGHEYLVNAVVFVPDGMSFITAGWGEESELIRWDFETGDIIQRYEANALIEGIAITPDGSSLLYGIEDTGALRYMSIETGDVIYEMIPDLGVSADSLQAVALSSDSTKALSGFGNSQMFLWDLTTGELIRTYTVDLGGIFAIAFVANDDTIVVGGASGVLKKVDLRTSNILYKFSGHDGGIRFVRATPDGNHVVTASADTTLRLWSLNPGQVVRQFTDASTGVQTWEVDLSPDGRIAIGAATDGTATLWDVETGEVIHQLVDDQPIMAVNFSPDGQTVLTGAGYRLARKVESGHIILWDVQTGEEIRRFEGQPYVVFDVEFSPDGHLAVSSGNGAVVILWDVETGEEIWRFDDYWVDQRYPIGTFLDVEFSPDGRTVLATRGDIIILDIETGEEIGQLQGHAGGIPGIVFSDDGNRMVSGGLDSQAILWDMQTNSIIYRFTNNTAPLGQVRFSLDEQFILGGSDQVNTLWDVDTGNILRRYGGGKIQQPVFSPDGRHALVGFLNGAVELWRIDPSLDDLLEWTQANRYIPDITCNQRELYRVEPFCESES